MRIKNIFGQKALSGYLFSIIIWPILTYYLLEQKIRVDSKFIIFVIAFIFFLVFM